MQLIKKPKATDLEICRGLDADGAVELPSSWKVRAGDWLFAEAYSNPRTRRKVEIAISKVRVPSGCRCALIFAKESAERRVGARRAEHEQPAENGFF
jgi:hypothetical protein